jgi:hypothetical protein
MSHVLGNMLCVGFEPSTLWAVHSHTEGHSSSVFNHYASVPDSFASRKEIQAATSNTGVLWVLIPTHERGTGIGHVTQFP